MSFLYRVRRYRGVRGIRIAIYQNGDLVVTTGKTTLQKTIQAALRQHALWIADAQCRRERARAIAFLAMQKTAIFRRHQHCADHYVRHLCAMFASRIGVQPKNITIRDQRSRWGSCSARGNLAFSYKIVFLPPAQAAYIVAHELCHLRHHHHRASFWHCVCAIIPDAHHKDRAVRSALWHHAASYRCAWCGIMEKSTDDHAMFQ